MAITKDQEIEFLRTRLRHVKKERNYWKLQCGKIDALYRKLQMQTYNPSSEWPLEYDTDGVTITEKLGRLTGEEGKCRK